MKSEDNYFKVLTERIKKDKKSLIIIVIGFLGMLMIMLSEITSDTPSDVNIKSSAYVFDGNRSKEELEALISKIDGAGKTSVIITYECSKENIYAQNISEYNEEKGDKKSGEHIIVDSGDDEEGLIVKEIYPKVLGVAVVCEGGNNPTVKNEITMLIKAVYGISSNKICITEMQK